MRTLNTLTENSAYNTTTKHIERSTRYQHIMTKDLGLVFQDHGFEISKYRERKAKDDVNAGYGNHLVKFRHRDAVVAKDTYFPEILVKNNHLGKGSLQLSLGVYRLVCANGLVVGKSFSELRIVHNLRALETLNQSVPMIMNSFQTLNQSIERMTSTIATQEQISLLASSAVKLLAENSADELVGANLNSIVKINRWADKEQTQWNIFNVIQENMFRRNVVGYFKNAETGLVESRTIRKPGEQSLRAVELNKGLWDAATTIFNQEVA